MSKKSFIWTISLIAVFLVLFASLAICQKDPKIEGIDFPNPLVIFTVGSLATMIVIGVIVLIIVVAISNKGKNRNSK